MRIWPRRTARSAISSAPPAVAGRRSRSGRTIPRLSATWGRHFKVWASSAEAVDHLRRALELRPDFVVAHNNLGIALRDLGRKDEALEHFRRAVELDPTFAPAQTNLGQTLLDLGQAEEALPHCQEAVRLDPNSAVCTTTWAIRCVVLERLVDAKVSYLEALAAGPEAGAVECPSRAGAPAAKASYPTLWSG